MTETKKKVLIVEDHPIFRWGISELINQEPDMLVRHAVHLEKTGKHPNGAPSP